MTLLLELKRHLLYYNYFNYISIFTVILLHCVLLHGNCIHFDSASISAHLLYKTFGVYADVRDVMNCRLMKSFQMTHSLFSIFLTLKRIKNCDQTQIKQTSNILPVYYYPVLCQEMQLIWHCMFISMLRL